MKILLDHCVPAPLQRFLPANEVRTAHELHWETLRNGELIAAAEQASFDLLITADQHWSHQQNLSGRKLAILVLRTNNWVELRVSVADIAAAVSAITSGEYREM